MVAFGSENPVFLSGELPSVGPVMIRHGLVDELEQLVERTVHLGLPWPMASLDAVRALVEETRGDPRTALERLLLAIEIADAHELVAHATRIRIDAARCAAAAGEVDLAGELLTRAKRDAESMGVRIYLDDIAALEEKRAATG